ncbi:uridylate-specific endoribonuclease C-like [Pelmatolapia mariae]|uniref:uridylate-specific endoribonuclease C-like n=1 Tax=Pelmatolapia mariae TaxID=158779 RepID=UPI002FE6B0B8
MHRVERKTIVRTKVTRVSWGFMNIISDVSPQRAHQYLVTESQSSSDLRLFKNQLHLIWFHLYHRQRNTGLDSLLARQNHWFSQLGPVPPAKDIRPGSMICAKAAGRGMAKERKDLTERKR